MLYYIELGEFFHQDGPKWPSGLKVMPFLKMCHFYRVCQKCLYEKYLHIILIPQKLSNDLYRHPKVSLIQISRQDLLK